MNESANVGKLRFEFAYQIGQREPVAAIPDEDFHAYSRGYLQSALVKLSLMERAIRDALGEVPS